MSCLSKILKDKKWCQADWVKPIPEKAPAPVMSTGELNNWFIPLGKGLSEVLRHHRTPDPIIDLLISQLRDYIMVPGTVEEVVKRTKYALTFPLSRYLRNPEPATDSPLEFRGAARRWFRNRINAFNRKNTHLWYSWLNCKRCCNSLPEELVPSLFIDHAESLSKDDQGDDEVIAMIMSNPLFTDLLDEIAQALPAAFMEESERIIFPSLSASLESRRGPSFAVWGDEVFSRGWGAAGHIRRVLDIDDDIHMEELVSIGYHPRLAVKNGYIKDAHIDYKKVIPDDSELEDLTFDQISFEDRATADIKLVFEPLKARVISKGPALPYFRAKPLQIALWKLLQRYPCFALTGRPASPTDLLPLTARSGQWFSVDYKASTDNLSWKYSEAIINRLCRCSNQTDIPALFDFVLGPHWLQYRLDGACDYNIFMRVLQKTGQLMGSILSFPILCLANLGLYLQVCRRRGYCSTDYLSEVIVNGDDMLYKASEDETRYHEFIGKSVGLELSAGKVYYHREYCNINSTCFHCRKDYPVEVPYYNVGLLMGRHKVQVKQSDGSWFAEDHSNDRSDISGEDKWKIKVACNMQTVLNGLYYPSDGSRCASLFLKLNEEQLEEDTESVISFGSRTRLFHRNLFIPVCFGGLGVTPPEGFKYKITPTQQLLASDLWSSYPSLRWSQRPLIAPEAKHLVPLQNQYHRISRCPERPFFRIERKYRMKKSSIRQLVPMIRVGSVPFV